MIPLLNYLLRTLFYTIFEKIVLCQILYMIIVSSIDYIYFNNGFNIYLRTQVFTVIFLENFNICCKMWLKMTVLALVNPTVLVFVVTFSLVIRCSLSWSS